MLCVPEADVSTFVSDFFYNSSKYYNTASYQIHTGIKNVLKYFVRNCAMYKSTTNLNRYTPFLT